jgi:hypothetical protein
MNDVKPVPECANLARAGQVSEAVEVARKLYLSGERIVAKQQADAIREAMPQTSDNLAALFRLYIDLDAQELAEQTATRLFRLEPNHIAGRRGMAEFHLKRWKLDKVRPHLSILVATAGLSADDLLFAARIYLRFATKVDAELACQLIKRSIDVAGKSSLPTRITLSEALMVAGRTGAALQEAETLTNAAGTAFELATVAELFVKLSRPKEALAVARRSAASAQLMNDAPAVKIMLAHIFTKLGHPNEAHAPLKLVDHAAISGTWLLKRFHDACFDAQLQEEALSTAKRLKIVLPDDPLFPQRIALLTIVGSSMPRADPHTPVEAKRFLPGIFRSRAAK